MALLWRKFGEWGERHPVLEIAALPAFIPISLIDAFLNVARRSGFPICPSIPIPDNWSETWRTADERAYMRIIRKEHGL